jgi:hypothetical protein
LCHLHSATPRRPTNYSCAPDGYDNDTNQVTDYPADTDCACPTDPTEGALPADGAST